MSDDLVTAREAAAKVWNDCLLALDDPGEDANPIDVILAAIAAEREACAKLIETMPAEIIEFWERPGGPPGNGRRPLRQADCVAAIRARAALGTMGDGQPGA